MKLHYYLTCLAVCLIAISCEKDFENTQEHESAQRRSASNFVPGEILIKFKDGNQSYARTKSDALSLINGNIIETITTAAMKTENSRKEGSVGELVLVQTKLATMDAIDKLRDLPEIEYAEPNWIYQHFYTADDPYFTNGSLWGMYGDIGSSKIKNQFGSQAAEAWTAGHIGSNTVWIGIIDEGYMFTHEDLADNAGENPFEDLNGVDDDGNGFKDDIYGWDFANNNNSVFDGVDDDHGTHVAGTIGAVGGNKKGIAGMVWKVKLMSAKFLGSNGGTTANAIKAVDYFTNLKSPTMNIVATNNSWGGGGFSQGLYDAIERANSAGILFIAAAGNNSSNIDSSSSYPASYTNSNIIAVASITSSGSLSSFSNYGASSVDIGAPGSSIYSTVPKRSRGQIISAYASYNGTSMATPHVTGACALYASTNPGATAIQIKAAILNNTISTTSLSGKCVTGGRLNVGGF